jgi:DNA repair protein RecN (Recombination protein N)
VGVGGTTADVVGRLLRGLAAHTQVICITHAPQIAALGIEHLKVSKDSEQDTRIAELDDGERVDELARMLAGARITDESRDYARTLLQDAGT